MSNGIGDRIKQIRGTQTQQEFADLIGVGRTTLIRYESGERTPDAEFLIKLNVIYSIQPLWLLTGKGEDVAGVKLTPRQRALLDNYDRAPEAGKKIIEGTASMAAQSGTTKAG